MISITTEVEVDVREALSTCDVADFQDAIEFMSEECMDVLQNDIGNYFTNPEEVYSIKDLSQWALENGFTEDE